MFSCHFLPLRLLQLLQWDLFPQHFLPLMLLQLYEQLHAYHGGVGEKDYQASYKLVEGRVDEEDGEEGQDHALTVHAGQPMLFQHDFHVQGVHCGQHSEIRVHIRAYKTAGTALVTITLLKRRFQLISWLLCLLQDVSGTILYHLQAPGLANSH